MTHFTFHCQPAAEPSGFLHHSRTTFLLTKCWCISGSFLHRGTSIEIKDAKPVHLLVARRVNLNDDLPWQMLPQAAPLLAHRQLGFFLHDLWPILDQYFVSDVVFWNQQTCFQTRQNTMDSPYPLILHVPPSARSSSVGPSGLQNSFAVLQSDRPGAVGWCSRASLCAGTCEIPALSRAPSAHCAY